jgi:para-nitrobenzyl esterase
MIDHHRRRVLKASALAGGVAFAQAVLARAVPAASGGAPVVATRYGRVRGATEDGIHAFKGIPYGAPTAGEARFRPPAPPKSWTGVRDALEFGPRCPQIDSPPQALWASWRVAEVESEDCLVLNVWTPGLDGVKRPVMVWFHGGGYAVSSGSQRIYQGARLSRRGDVVVVTVNHRLHAFGYLYLAELGDERYRDSGNVGQLDLIAALAWVRDNIDRFGGDPNRVMIFGESGGGGKVSTLMAMPAAKGLFHRAAIQSGPGLLARAPHLATQDAVKLLDTLQIPRARLERLQRVPTRDFLTAVRTAFGVPFGLAPVLDGQALPRQPWMPDAPEVSAEVPVMVGYTKDETSLNAQAADFTHTWDTLHAKLQPSFGRNTDRIIETYRRTRPDATPGRIYIAATTDADLGWGSITLAERKWVRSHTFGGAPAYLYRVEWETPMAGGKYGSPHTIELPLVFDNLAVSESLIPREAWPRAQEVSNSMTAAWVAFAATGSPNRASLPEWKPYDLKDRATMIFDTQTRLELDPHREERLLFASLPQGGR